jgi:hypothetical protein
MGEPVIDASDDRVPAPWKRVLGIVAAVFMVGYGMVGLWRNDLHVSLSKTANSGVHLRGILAWLCFAGMVMMALGLTRFVAWKSGEREFDFDARRRRHGPMFFGGLAVFVVTQAIADWLS